MSVPARPPALFEGPAQSCMINGRAMGWTNCTPTATAMAVRKATLQREKPTGCSIRRLTGDTSGGTTIPQCVNAANREYGLAITTKIGNNSATPTEFAKWLRAGRGVVFQGNAGALLHTPFRSTGGYVNHAVYANDGRGWHRTSSGVWLPREVRVYDPAADGRRAGWGKADDSPGWWPWAIVKKFAASLRPWGDSDHRILGPGRIYSAAFPDTEPHNHPKYGSHRTSPFPDHVVINVPAGHRAHVRSRPDRVVPGDIVARLPDGKSWVAYQVTHGAKPDSATSDLWYGNHNGTRWIHASNLARIGGAS